MQRLAHPLLHGFLGELVDDLELGLSEDSDLASDEEGLRPALSAMGGAAPAPAAAGKGGGSFLEVVMQAQLHAWCADGVYEHTMHIVVVRTRWCRTSNNDGIRHVTWRAHGMHMVMQAQLAAKEDWQALTEHRQAKAEAEEAEEAEATAAARRRGAGARELAAARRRRAAHDASRLEECELLGYRRRIMHPNRGWLRLAELRRSVVGRRLCRRRFSAALLDLARRRVAEDVSLEDAMGQIIIRLQTFFERAASKHEPIEHSLIPQGHRRNFERADLR